MRHLLILFGPPAVGKMTVGLELERCTGLPLFHNHMTIDPVLRFFPFGSPPFQRLVSESRWRIFAEVAARALPGMIFTYVWAFDHPENRVFQKIRPPCSHWLHRTACQRPQEQSYVGAVGPVMSAPSHWRIR